MNLPSTITGKVWLLGNHVNTDLLHPPSLFTLEEERLQAGLMARERALATPTLPQEEGLIIVAGENLGCGSSRESTVRALRLGGVKGVVARSFARIFFRTLANLGIPPLVCGEVQGLVQNGDPITIFLAAGYIELGDGKRYPFAPLDPHIERILAVGGLIPYLRREGWGMTTM